MNHQTTRRHHLSLLATAFVAAAALPVLAIAEEPVPAAETAAAQEVLPKLGDPGFVNYLLDRIDDVSRGNSSHALMQMKVKTKHYTRAM
ncbi:MAG: hypothetical protein ACPG77_18425, partial [Nannocystaceae bacterium]